MHIDKKKSKKDEGYSALNDLRHARINQRSTLNKKNIQPAKILCKESDDDEYATGYTYGQPQQR